MRFKALLMVISGVVLVNFAILRAQPLATDYRVISADLMQVKGPKSTVFRRCVGAGRVAEGLRADWQDQLRTCRQAIGFEYLRCHGLFHDELGVYSEDAQGHPIYNWQYIDMVYDFLLSIGVRPFVEIGFMPQALASIKSEPVPAVPGSPVATAISAPVFWWKANVTPPKSWDRWDGLVTALVQHWTERYGAEEVKQWYFEIWNEPNHPSFFHPTTESSRRDEYFTLYDHTAKAVTAVNPAYRVGGPSGAGPVWIGELIAYCSAKKVPLDFISFHSYGLGGGPSGLDVEGRRRLYLDRKLDTPGNRAHSQDAIIQKSSMPNLPVHITEWSSSYSNHDPVHDSYFEAPYILQQLKKTETIGSMSYWTFTDIFEESGPPKTPFEGGFGLINLQGIKKASFFAYQFLNQLGDDELKNSDDRSWLCRDNKGGVQALVYDLTDPRDLSTHEDDWTVFRQRIVPKPKPTVQLRITSLKPGSYHFSVYRIGFEENDAYSEYLKIGAPPQLTLEQVRQFKSLASGAPSEQADVTIDSSGEWKHDFSMRENEVFFTSLSPVTAH
jgi:xylan 1,4-beta-xylosidase